MLRSSRPSLASGGLLAAGLASLALAGPAAAGTPEYYGVEVDATVETSYTGEEHSQAVEHDVSLALSTRVTAGFLAVIDRDASGRIIGATGQDQHVATTTGSILSRERRFAPEWNDWYEYATACTGAGENKNDEGRTTLRPDPLTPLVGASLVLNLADRLEVNATCENTGRDGGVGPRSALLESPLPEDDLVTPTGPLAVAFDLPREATAAGKVIQLFEGPAAGQAAYCPTDLAERSQKKACTVRFRGTITMTKTDLGMGQPAPTAPAPTAPAKPAPSSSDDDLLAPLVPPKQAARIGAKASSLSFRAACRGGCSGTATVRVPAPRTRAKGKPATRRLAVVRVAVPKGTKARTVRVAVPRKARAALRRAKGATVVLRLKDRRSGRSTSTTLAVRR
jgi:hypothetical protein